MFLVGSSLYQMMKIYGFFRIYRHSRSLGRLPNDRPYIRMLFEFPKTVYNLEQVSRLRPVFHQFFINYPIAKVVIQYYMKDTTLQHIMDDLQSKEKK